MGMTKGILGRKRKKDKNHQNFLTYCINSAGFLKRRGDWTRPSKSAQESLPATRSLVRSCKSGGLNSVPNKKRQGMNMKHIGPLKKKNTGQ